MDFCTFVNGVCVACFAPHVLDRQVCGVWLAIASPALPTRGPGTETKKLLAKVGITASADCSCNARAAEMDRQGVEWCEANTDTIVGWLREQAEARGLPFLDIAGRLLVRRAIQNARKAAAGG